MSVVQGEDVESDDECGYETPEDKDEIVVDGKEDISTVPCVKGQGTVVAGEESETDEEDGSDRETTELPRPLSKNVAKDHEVISPGESERPLVATGKPYVYNRFVLAISRHNIQWTQFVHLFSSVVTLIQNCVSMRVCVCAYVWSYNKFLSDR